MIKERIQEAFEMGKLDLTPRAFMAYTAAMQNTLVRQFIDKREADPLNWKRVSSFGCARQKAAIKFGVPTSSTLPFKTVARFMLGDIVEAWYATLMKMAGIGGFGFLGEQITLKTPLGDGHPDGFLYDEGVTKGPASEIWENKGSAAWGWSKFDKIPDGSSVAILDDAFGYATQVATYGHTSLDLGFLKEPKVRFTYIAFEDSYRDGCKALDVSEKLLYLDSDSKAIVQRRREEVVRIESASSPWELPMLPLLEGGKLPVTCNYCAYRTPCWEADGKTLMPLSKKGWRVI